MWNAAVNTWRAGQFCPHWRLTSSHPRGTGEAKLSRVADAKQCLKLFAGKEKVNRREKQTEGGGGRKGKGTKGG